MARHKGANFDKRGVIEAIRGEVGQNPAQPAASISEKVYGKTGIKPSVSYVLTIRSRSESYRRHIMERAHKLEKEVERLDTLSLRLQKSADALATEFKRANKSGDGKRVEKLFDEEMSIWGVIGKTNEMLMSNCNRLDRLNNQIAGWRDEEPVARKPLLSVLYDTQKWNRMFREAKPANRGLLTQ